jgi:ATP-binding cassette subfamily C protein
MDQSNVRRAGDERGGGGAAAVRVESSAAPKFLPALAAFMGDIVRYAGPRALTTGLLVGAGAVLESLGLVLLVPILGVVVGSGKGGAFRQAAATVFGWFHADDAFRRLAVLLTAFGGLMLLRSIVSVRRDVRLAELQIGFLETQRVEVAERLAGARWDRLARLRHARITNLMSGDIQRVGAGVTFLLQTTVSVVILASQCALALLLSPGLALVAIALLALIGAALGPLVRRAQALGAFVTSANLRLLDSAAQFLGGLKLAVSQDLQQGFVDEFSDTLHALRTRQVEAIRQRSYGRLILTITTSAVGGVLVLVGFGLMHVPATVLITLILIISRMSGPVGQIQQGVQQVALALPAYAQVAELKQELAAMVAPPAPAAAAFPEGPVRFAAVTFRHPGDEASSSSHGVCGLDLTLEPGEFVGVGGPSGAGKTTFGDLLSGLLPPQSGAILVGGAPLAGPTLSAWRRGISYVSQDPFLFHDTVRRNLAWGSPEATEAQMWDALALTGAEEVVRGMEQGLDTVVGERGALVSGGERQRIALARALLRRPRLLILDEATNAIDVAAEATLLEQLKRLAPRPTIVLIAHRAESLAHCQRVLRLEDGRLAEAQAPL